MSRPPVPPHLCQRQRHESRHHRVRDPTRTFQEEPKRARPRDRRSLRAPLGDQPAGIAQSVILRWRITASVTDMTAEAERVFPIFLAGLR